MRLDQVSPKSVRPRHGDVIVDRYRLGERLGEGGAGVVFGATDEWLLRRVAIKLPTGARDAREYRGALLEREAQLAASLRSDHVVRVIDLSYLRDGTPFSVMELLDGATLGDVLDRDGLPPTDVAAQIAIETCAALAEVHAEGIVHRDIKPDNLMLARRLDGVTTVKVIDFGSSRGAHPDALVDDGRPVGTPGYMAPEQVLRPERCDPRTDLWGVGMVLYEMLTGVLPFEASSVTDVFRKTVAGNAPPVTVHRPDVPIGLQDVVMRCLAHDPDRRFEDASSLALALAPFATYPEAAAEVRTVECSCRGRSSDDDAPSPTVLPLAEHVETRKRPAA